MPRKAESKRGLCLDGPVDICSFLIWASKASTPLQRRAAGIYFEGDVSLSTLGSELFLEAI